MMPRAWRNAAPSALRRHRNGNPGPSCRENETQKSIRIPSTRFVRRTTYIEAVDTMKPRALKQQGALEPPEI